MQQGAFSAPNQSGSATPENNKWILALILTLIFPGAGHLVMGNTQKGIIMLSGYIVSLALTLVCVGWIGVLGFWIWALVDFLQNYKSSGQQ